MVGRDAVGDLLEENRLAGLGRRYDQRALAAADRGDHVNYPGREKLGRCREDELLVREHRRHVLEPWTLARGFRVRAVHDLDAEKTVVPVPLVWRLDLSGYHVAVAQAKSADLRL